MVLYVSSLYIKRLTAKYLIHEVFTVIAPIRRTPLIISIQNENLRKTNMLTSNEKLLCLL